MRNPANAVKHIVPHSICAIALLSLSFVNCAAAPAKPHIILIVADDFGYGDLSCYGGRVQTRNLDRLAREGVRFTQYYSASPICSPSRCGLLTGQFPARWRITSYLQTRAANAACEQDDFLDPNAPTLPRTLKAAGYATAHIGKWHLGGGRDVTNAPKFAAYGYDVGLGTWESPERAPELGVKFAPWDQRKEPEQVERHDRTRWMVDQSLAFIRERQATPCFISLWLDDTHTPFRPSADQLRAVGVTSEKPADKELFRAVLHEMDAQIGRLMAGLRDLGLETNTLILFLSDNGALPTFGQSRVGGLRGSKLSLFEGGIRVPLVVRWPGRTPKGKVDEQTMITAVDLFPTLCRIAHAPAAGDANFDGEDMSAALFGKPITRQKRVFWEYGRNTNSFAYPRDPYHRSPNLAVREGPWKLLMDGDVARYSNVAASGGGNPQLYDVLSDPHETKDLASEKPVLAGRLRDALLEWRKEWR
jgi:arylsulfatase A-like enzyme